MASVDVLGKTISFNSIRLLVGLYTIDPALLRTWLNLSNPVLKIKLGLLIINALIKLNA